MPPRNSSAGRSGDIRMALRPHLMVRRVAGAVLLIRDRSRTRGLRSAVRGPAICGGRTIRRVPRLRSWARCGGLDWIAEETPR